MQSHWTPTTSKLSLQADRSKCICVRGSFMSMLHRQAIVASISFMSVYISCTSMFTHNMCVCVHLWHMWHVYHDIMNIVYTINSIMNGITYQTIIVFRHLHDKTIVDSVQFAQDNHVTWAVSVSTAIHQLHFRSSGVPTADHTGACSGWEPCTQNFDSDMQGAWCCKIRVSKYFSGCVQ